MASIRWLFSIVAVFVLILIVGGYIFLANYDYNSLKPRITSAAMEATGRRLTIGGDIRLSLGLTPALVLKDVSFENAAWGSRAEMAKIERLEIEVALMPLFSRQFVVKRLVLFLPDLLIEKDRGGQLNIDLKTARKDNRMEEEAASGALKSLSALTVNRMSVKNGLLIYRDRKSGKTTKLLIGALEIASSGKDMPIEVMCKGEMANIPFEAKGTLGALSAIAGKEEPWPVALNIEALGAAGSLNGSIREPLDLRGIDLGFTARAEDLKEILAAVGCPVPLQGPLEIKGRISAPAARTLRISEMMLRLGDNLIRGAIEIRTGAAPKTVSAVVETDRLDLNPFFQKPEGAKNGPADKKVKRVFPDDRISISVLKSLNGSMKIHADKVFLPRLSIDNLSTEMTLRHGELVVNPLTAVIGAGTVSGNMMVGARADAINVSAFLTAEDVNMDSVLQEMDVTDVSGGRLQAELDLRAHGDSIAGWMKNLDGYVLVISDGGRINNKYIELLGGGLSSGLFRMLNPSEGLSDTEINCLVSRFDIKSGEAKNTALVMDTPETTVVGGGKIDLGTEELDIFLKPHPKGLAGVGLSLAELTSPFKLGGTLSEPSLAIDPAQSALVIGKAVGGVVLFGPLGIAAVLASGTKRDGNPCLKAIEAARTGTKSEMEVPKGNAAKTGDGSKKEAKGFGARLKEWFKAGPTEDSEDPEKEYSHKEY